MGLPICLMLPVHVSPLMHLLICSHMLTQQPSHVPAHQLSYLYSSALLWACTSALLSLLLSPLMSLHISSPIFTHQPSHAPAHHLSYLYSSALSWACTSALLSLLLSPLMSLHISSPIFTHQPSHEPAQSALPSLLISKHLPQTGTTIVAGYDFYT
jgi:hypothetical protein